jgi:Flp pilus assembly protein TadG
MRFRTEVPRKRWSSRKGQSAVELAVIVPVLTLLLVVVADFGRVFFVNIAVNNAARAGAQFGSQSTTNAAQSDQIKKAAALDFGCVASGSVACPNFPNWSTPVVTVCTCKNPPDSVTPCAGSYCGNTTTATYVEVDTSATYTTLLNYPGITSSYTLTGKAIMQVQR